MDRMAVTPRGFKIIIAGLVVMIVGYILMTGGGSDDPQVFNYEMFNFRRLTLAPIVITAGIVTIVYGIMGRTDNKK